MTDSIIETLRRAIREGDRVGSSLTEISISDAAARQMAGELAAMQMTPRQSEADIYLGLKAGTSKFMDRKVTVATSEHEA